MSTPSRRFWIPASIFGALLATWAWTFWQNRPIRMPSHLALLVAACLLLAWLLAARLCWQLAGHLFPELSRFPTRKQRRHALFQACLNPHTQCIAAIPSIALICVVIFLGDPTPQLLPLLGPRTEWTSGIVSLFLLGGMVLLLFALPPLLSQNAIRNQLRAQLNAQPM